MLLNASHVITNCGLPQHIQDRYVRYKQGNRAIVAWMTKYGPEKFKGRKTLPIKQMIALGNILCDKVQELGTLPSDVDYYFKEVIKERTYLSEHYRSHRDQCEKDQVDTINHEHFTESLQQIHKVLLTAGRPGIRPKSKASPIRKARTSSSVISTSELRLTFDRLLLDADQICHGSDESDDDHLSDTETDATSECSHADSNHRTCACVDEEDADFLDSEGRLGFALDAVLFLQSIQKVAFAIRDCWVKAGEGEIVVAAAATYTNILLCRALDYVRRLEEDENAQFDLQNLRSQIADLDCSDHEHEASLPGGILEVIDALVDASDCIRSSKPKSSCTLSSEVQGATLPGSASSESLISKIVADLTQLSMSPPASTLTLDGLSLVISCRYSQTQSFRSDDMLGTCVAVYLLATSHSAYSSVLTQPNRIAVPRISALKLANEALSTIDSFLDDKAIFPCQCINTLGYRVAQMKHDLQAFAKFKCWNTIMQSPHIAGNHVLEVLDLCSYYGMHLFHYRQYVAGILHCYQALMQLNYLNQIPILEDVCDMFAHMLYPAGVRSESGFVATWLRYIGARLRFRKGKKYQDHKDTWCMSVPAHTAARSAGLNINGKDDRAKLQPKFDYGGIDCIIKMKHEGWVLNMEQASMLTRQLEGETLASGACDTMFAEQPTNPTQKTRKTRHKRSKSCKVDTKCEATGHDHACTKLDHVFNASFTIDTAEGRNLPPSRFNLLSFFHSMTKVVSGISDATHADDGKDISSSTKDGGSGQMCLCFVQTILRGADRIQDVRKRSGLDAAGATWSKNERNCIECYKEHLMKMLEQAKVMDGSGGNWLWSRI